MKPIKVKVTVTAGSFSCSYEEDYTDYAKTLIECNNVFTSTNVKMTEKNILEYFKPGIFKGSEIDTLNGDHFIYGWLESFAQSRRCPEELFEYNDEIYFEVELIKEEIKTKNCISAVTIGKLIEAHMKGDEEKFLSYANFIAEAYEQEGDELGAKIIRKRIDGTMDNEPQVSLD